MERKTGVPPNDQPLIRDLQADEIKQFLKLHNLGRIAFSFHDRVDIEPINYAYENGWIYGRTSPGTKLSVIAHHRWVAFEVDEVRGLFDWCSVVIKGIFEIIPTDMSTRNLPNYTVGVKMIRKFDPNAFTPNDMVSFRRVLFRIHLDEISGKESKLERAI